MHRGYVIPDRVFFVLTSLVLAICWAVAVMMLPLVKDLTDTSELTAVYSAQGSVFPVSYLLPMFEIILFIAFAAFYHTPQQASLRPGLALGAVPEPQRTFLIRVYRHFIVMMLLLLELIVTYMFFANVITMVGDDNGLYGLLLIILMTLLFGLVLFYWLWMTSIASQAMSTGPRSSQPK